MHAHKDYTKEQFYEENKNNTGIDLDQTWGQIQSKLKEVYTDFEEVPKNRITKEDIFNEDGTVKDCDIKDEPVRPSATRRRSNK